MPPRSPAILAPSTEMTVTSQQALERDSQARTCTTSRSPKLFANPPTYTSQAMRHAGSVTVAFMGETAATTVHRCSQPAGGARLARPNAVAVDPARPRPRPAFPERWTQLLSPLPWAQAGDKVHKLAGVLKTARLGSLSPAGSALGAGRDRAHTYTPLWGRVGVAPFPAFSKK